MPPVGLTRRTFPQAIPTAGSANGRTSRRSASESQRTLASPKATMAPVVSATARSWAATLPPRGQWIRRTPRSAKPATAACVPSVESSEVTTISSRSAG